MFVCLVGWLTLVHFNTYYAIPDGNGTVACECNTMNFFIYLVCVNGDDINVVFFIVPIQRKLKRPYAESRLKKYAERNGL